jgi:AraC family transcriptional regulator
VLLQAFAQSNRKDEAIAGFPNWLIHVKELIHNSTGAALSLTQIATQAGVHPATLTKAFPKFFHCTVGEYIRKVRIEYSLALLAKRSLSLDDVAFACGFYDASHYIGYLKS